MKGIQLTAHGDFALEGGRIALGEADLQSADTVIRAARGEFKEAPLIGGELFLRQGGAPDAAWCVQVRKMLRSVGIKVKSVSMDARQIQVKL